MTDEFPVRSQTFVVRHLVGLYDAGTDVWMVAKRIDRSALRSLPEMASRPDLFQRVRCSGIGHNPWLAARAAVSLLVLGLRQPRSTLRLLRACGAPSPAGLRAALLATPLLGLRPEVVHVEFGTEGLRSLHLRAGLGCALTVSFRGFDLNYAGLDDPEYYTPLWSGVDGVHVLGDDLMRRARRRGCPEDLLVARIPPAVDVSYFDPGVCPVAEVGPARPLRVLSVSRLHWKKGLVDGLLAVRSLVDSGVAAEYHIVGEGNAADEVKAAVDDLGLAGHVTMAGPTDRAGVRAALAWADVMLHPALSEGFGNAVLEAQAMAVPVVTTDADGLAENVAHGETGFVVARRDHRAMASYLGRLATDATLRNRMGQAGRARAAARFTPGAEAEAFLRFFDEVAARD